MHMNITNYCTAWLIFFLLTDLNCQAIIWTESFSGKLATATTPCWRVYKTADGRWESNSQRFETVNVTNLVIRIFLLLSIQKMIYIYIITLYRKYYIDMSIIWLETCCKILEHIFCIHDVRLRIALLLLILKSLLIICLR